MTIYIILKSVNSEKYIEPITKMEEIYQTVLMELIQKLLKEFDGDNQNSNELDSFIKKEKKLLEKLDELEVENIQLNNKIAELRDNQGGVEKKIGEMNEILNTKNNEIKNLQKEKEKLQNQVIIFFYFVSLNFLKRFIKFSSRLRSII